MNSYNISNNNNFISNNINTNNNNNNLHHNHNHPENSNNNIDNGERNFANGCKLCNCSSRVLTCIILTIIPIAITLTLICVFMMQKTNLYEYAIYTFVVFCVAFVFPFALFFITVIFNKIYKFYKRIRINSTYNISNLHDNNTNHNNTNDISNNEFTSSSPSCPDDAIICTVYPSDGQQQHHHDSSDHSYLFDMSHHQIVPHYNYNNYHHYDHCLDYGLTTMINNNYDNPPTYEMALLCPKVPYSESDVVNNSLVLTNINNNNSNNNQLNSLPPPINLSQLDNNNAQTSPPPYDEKMK